MYFSPPHPEIFEISRTDERLFHGKRGGCVSKETFATGTEEGDG